METNNINKHPLSVEHLNLSIDDRPILKNIDLVFPENKITCIVGPSGCGKSTLLKTLNRLIDNVDNVKVDGKIMIGDKNIIGAGYSDLIELRRRIGLVPQRPCPLPMSIFENVAYGCRIHGMHPKKKELADVVEHYLTEVGLWEEVKDRLQSSAMRLSIGQQQRLCLARSLAVEPDYILADEATSALIPCVRRCVSPIMQCSCISVRSSKQVTPSRCSTSHVKNLPKNISPACLVKVCQPLCSFRFSIALVIFVNCINNR